MPQLYFDMNTFKSRQVDTSKASLNHSRLLYETQNILKMNLSAKEVEQAFKLLKST